MNVKKDILWRVLVSILMLTILGGAIVYSIVRVQYAEGDEWRAIGDSLHVRHQQIPAVRGSIYSDDGSLLATSVPIYKISIDFSVIHEHHRDSFKRYQSLLAASMSKVLKNRTEQEYVALIQEGYRKKRKYVTVIRNASFIQSKSIKSQL